MFGYHLRDPDSVNQSWRSGISMFNIFPGRMNEKRHRVGILQLLHKAVKHLTKPVLCSSLLFSGSYVENLCPLIVGIFGVSLRRVMVSVHCSSFSSSLRAHWWHPKQQEILETGRERGTTFFFVFLSPQGATVQLDRKQFPLQLLNLSLNLVISLGLDQSKSPHYHSCNSS